MGRSVHRVFVPFKDGTKKRIEFGPNAFAAVEEELGIANAISLFENKQSVANALGFRTLRAFLWAGLVGAGSEYTITEVGDQIVIPEMVTYWREITRAVALSIGGTVKLEQAEKQLKEAEKSAPDPTMDSGSGG